MPDFYSGLTKPGDLFCMITDGYEHATAEELKSFLIEHGPSEEELLGRRPSSTGAEVMATLSVMMVMLS